MHHSRLCALLIDCKTADVDEAARFWAAALGRPVDSRHPGSRGNYRMLETPPDEPIVEIQHVAHDSRVHIDIETDDIPAEVARLEKLGAKVAERLEPDSAPALCVCSARAFRRTPIAGSEANELFPHGHNARRGDRRMESFPYGAGCATLG